MGAVERGDIVNTQELEFQLNIIRGQLRAIIRALRANSSSDVRVWHKSVDGN